MQNEIVTQSHILTPGVEQSFGTLTMPHELTEIIVNANGAGEANHSSWRLYDTTAAGGALIWEGVLSPPFAVAQRLTPKEGIVAGALVELRALLDSKETDPTSVAVTASIIGYDPNCCAENTGPTGADGGGEFADFFALMPGDNASTVGLGEAVEFPQDGPQSGGIVRDGASFTDFVLPNIGTYFVQWEVSVDEAGQLQLELDSGGDEGFVTVDPSTVGRATGTSQIVGMCMVTTTVENSVIHVVNPPGNAAALTITPIAGGTNAVSAHLIIQQVA